MLFNKTLLILLLLSPVGLFGQNNKQCNQDSLKKINYSGICQSGKSLLFYRKGIVIKKEFYQSDKVELKLAETKFKNNKRNTTIFKTYYTSGKVKSKNIRKKNVWKISSWDKLGKKMLKKKVRIKNWSSVGGLKARVTWTFKENGKFKFKREKGFQSPLARFEPILLLTPQTIQR